MPHHHLIPVHPRRNLKMSSSSQVIRTALGYYLRNIFGTCVVISFVTGCSLTCLFIEWWMISATPSSFFFYRCEYIHKHTLTQYTIVLSICCNLYVSIFHLCPKHIEYRQTNERLFRYGWCPTNGSPFFASKWWREKKTWKNLYANWWFAFCVSPSGFQSDPDAFFSFFVPFFYLVLCVWVFIFSFVCLLTLSWWYFHFSLGNFVVFPCHCHRYIFVSSFKTHNISRKLRGENVRRSHRIKWKYENCCSKIVEVKTILIF